MTSLVLACTHVFLYRAYHKILELMKGVIIMFEQLDTTLLNLASDSAVKRKCLY